MTSTNESASVAYDVFKGVTLFASAGVPVIGGPLSTGLGMIFGAADADGQKTAIWDAVKTRVEQAITNARVTTMRNDLERSLSGIESRINSLQNYQGAAYLTELISIENDVEAAKSNFMRDASGDTDGDVFYSVPYFVQWANLHLGLLKTKATRAASDNDPNKDAYTNDYSKATLEYARYAYCAQKAALSWRRGRITARDSEKYTTEGGSGRLGIGERRVPTGKYSCVYRDAEEPDDNFTDDDASSQRATAKRRSKMSSIEQSFADIVGQALAGWVENGVLSHPVSGHGTDRVKRDQILVDGEKIVSPNGQYELWVKGDTVEEMGPNRTPIFVKNFPGKKLFVMVSEPGSFEIWSGPPHKPVKQEWAATDETWPNVWLRVQNDNNLCVYQYNASRPDGYFRWGTRQELAALREAATLDLNITSVRFEIIDGGEGMFPGYDAAEVDRLGLYAKVGNGAEETVAWWSTSGEWEVDGGEEKTVNSTWAKSLARGNKGENITFRAYVREYDSGSSNESYEATTDVGVTHLWDNALALDGAPFADGRKVTIWGGDVKLYAHFTVNAVLDMPSGV